MGNITVPTGEQLRAARALLRMEQAQVAMAAGVSVETVKRLERITGPITGSVTTTAAIVSSLESKGVIFIPSNGEGPGVRLRKQ